MYCCFVSNKIVVVVVVVALSRRRMARWRLRGDGLRFLAPRRRDCGGVIHKKNILCRPVCKQCGINLGQASRARTTVVGKTENERVGKKRKEKKKLKMIDRRRRTDGRIPSGGGGGGGRGYAHYNSYGSHLGNILGRRAFFRQFFSRVF